jgi:hypothetical protein
LAILAHPLLDLTLLLNLLFDLLEGF